MNIYVGNLPREASEEDLKGAFSAYGAVSKASIIKDKFTGDSRGFGFVEMSSDEEARKAIAELNGKELKGRSLTVNEARPKAEGGAAGFGGGGAARRGGGFGGGGAARRSGGFGGGDRGDRGDRRGGSR